MSEVATRPLRIGLTGGIACGKSTVADLFAARGVPIIDTDVLARQVVEPGTPGLAAIVAAFGKAILQADGMLDRVRMRHLIFANPAARDRLDRILHPLILDAALRAAGTAGGPYQVFAVPLLTETGFDRHMDRVLVVDCPPELQQQRLMSRDSESAAAAEAMIAAQARPHERLALADDIVHNDGTLADLDSAVERLHRQYLALAANRKG